MMSPNSGPPFGDFWSILLRLHPSDSESILAVCVFAFVGGLACGVAIPILLSCVWKLCRWCVGVMIRAYNEITRKVFPL